MYVSPESALAMANFLKSINDGLPAPAASSAVESPSPVIAMSSSTTASTLSTATIASTSTLASSASIVAPPLSTNILTPILPAKLDISNSGSIQGVARSLAMGVMSYYNGTAYAFSDLPKPYYWWECGSVMNAMLDYSHYTGDNSYDTIISTALAAQAVAPTYNLMVPAHFGDEGNDDLAVWGFAIMTAAERNFLNTANSSVPSWLNIAQNTFDSLASRWNTTACGGGLLWQIFASNPNGLDYRNSVSNGGFFQLAARLYRATGNQTYSDWANKIYDWSTGVGFVDADYKVYDGASSAENCSTVNKLSFSYAHGIYLYGSAVMANTTGEQTWLDRTNGFVNAASSFYSPYDNSTNVMYEQACETVDKCNTDMLSFKGMFSRHTYAATMMVPSIIDTVAQRQNVSVRAAANACIGGDNSATCGEKWYTGTYDGNSGLGQQMSAMEAVQGMLVESAPPPLKGSDIKDIRVALPAQSSATTSGPAPTSAPAASNTRRSNGGDVKGRAGMLMVFGAAVGAAAWMLL